MKKSTKSDHHWVSFIQCKHNNIMFTFQLVLFTVSTMYYNWHSISFDCSFWWLSSWWAL